MRTILDLALQYMSKVKEKEIFLPTTVHHSISLCQAKSIPWSVSSQVLNFKARLVSQTEFSVQIHL